MPENRIINIIILRLNNDASLADLAELDRWLAESEANRSYFREMQMIWQAKPVFVPVFDSTTAFETVLNKLN